MLDHLRVVVGGQERLALAALGHRQVADEVGQPGERGALQLGVLVQEVVELPRLVAHPQVVVLVADDVVEDHEVRQQDLVHPPQRLEAVQLVAARLADHVLRLAGELRARGMHPLAAGLEHLGDRVLRQPVDLEAGMEHAQLVDDREIATRVAEADGRRDVEHPLRPPGGAHPPGRRWRRHGEVAQQQVEPHRVAHVRRVAAALHQHQPRVGQPLGDRGATPAADDGVLGPLDQQHRAPDAGQLVVGVDPVAADAEQDGVGIGLETPADGILDLLRRVGLREALAVEELEVALPVARPVVAVLLGPALVGVEHVVERGSLARDRADVDVRPDLHQGRDPLGMPGREQHLRAAAPGDDDRLLDAVRVEHGDRVLCRLLPAVRRAFAGPVGPAVAARIEADHAAVPGEVGDLAAPEARVDDLPRGHEQDRRLAVSVALPEHPDAVALDEATRVRVAGARLFGRTGHRHRCRRRRHVSLLGSMVPV